MSDKRRANVLQLLVYISLLFWPLLYGFGIYTRFLKDLELQYPYYIMEGFMVIIIAIVYKISPKSDERNLIASALSWILTLLFILYFNSFFSFLSYIDKLSGK
jgi:hypothetical protein